MSSLDRLNAAMDKYKTSNNEFFTLENDKDTTTVKFLYDTVEQLDWFVVHEVTIGGKKRWLKCPETAECPCCAMGSKPQIKLFLQLIDKRDNKVKTWERGQKFVPKILGLFDSYGPLTNRVYDVERNGAKGDTSTDYSLYPMEPDHATLEVLKAAGYERQQLLGPDGFVLEKSIDEMRQIVNGTYSYPRVDNPAARQAPAGGVFGGGPGFGTPPSQPQYTPLAQPQYTPPQQTPAFGGQPANTQGAWGAAPQQPSPTGTPNQWDNAPQQHHNVPTQPYQQQQQPQQYQQPQYQQPQVQQSQPVQPPAQPQGQAQQWGSQEQPNQQWGNQQSQPPANTSRATDVF